MYTKKDHIQSFNQRFFSFEKLSRDWHRKIVFKQMELLKDTTEE